jgi:hypothetical protein
VKTPLLKSACLIACLVAIVVLGAPHARAQEPGPDPTALGKADALLSYCTKAAPGSRQKYWTQVKALSKDASKEQLAAVRRSEEYRKAHQAVDDFVAKVDSHNAQLLCGQPVAASK